MPSIPIMSVVTDGGALRTGSIRFNGIRIDSDADRDLSAVIREMAERSGKGSDLALVDVRGLEQKAMDLDAMKKIRTRKANVWLMTFVEDVGDVFDAFYMDIDTLMVPYHTLSSGRELDDILRISDRCIPSIFVEKKRAVSKNGREDVLQALRAVRRSGPTSVAVLDVDGSFDAYDWEMIFNEFDGTVPFSANASEELIRSLNEIGFGRVLTS